MLHRVLVADDLRTDSPSAIARSEILLDLGTRLATGLKGVAELISIVDLGKGFSAQFLEQIVDEVLGEKKKRLKELASESKTEVLVETKIIQGLPVPTLIKLTKRKKYDCVVLGTQGKTGMSRLLLGSVAEEVVRHSKIPVFVVGPKVGSAKHSISKILLATDFESDSQRAESYALKLARAFEAEVIFVHCLYGGMHPILQTAIASSASESKFQDLVEELTEEVEGKMENKRKHFEKRGVLASSSINTKKLSSSEALIEEVQEYGADLVIMGTHGRNRIGQAFFGSTVRGAILNSPVPVVTVKPV